MARDDGLTAAQSQRIFELAEKRGLDTERLDAGWTRAGLEREACSGSVRDFLGGLDREGAARLIETLGAEAHAQREPTQNWLQGTSGWFVDNLLQASAALHSVEAREHFAEQAARGDVPSWFVRSQCDAIEKLRGGGGELQQPQDANRTQRAVYRAVEMGAALAEATPERVDAWRQETGFPGGRENNPRMVAAAFAADCVAQRLHDRAAELQALPRSPAELSQLVGRLEEQLGKAPAAGRQGVDSGVGSPPGAGGGARASSLAEQRGPGTDTEWER